jgi:hypothetical protein
MEDSQQSQQEKRRVRFDFGVEKLDAYEARNKDLGFIEASTLGEEELKRFEERAQGWPYMMDMDDPKASIGRYASYNNKFIELPDGKCVKFTSEDARECLTCILGASKSTDSKTKESHLDLMGKDGGRFKIACDDEERQSLKREHYYHHEKWFLKMYAVAVRYGHNTCLVEKHTPMDNPEDGNKIVYFMDLDIKQPEIVPPKYIEGLVFVIVAQLKRFYVGCSEDLFKSICATATVKLERCKACQCTSCEANQNCEVCNNLGNTGLNKNGHACSSCGGKYPVKKKTGIHLHFPHIVMSTLQALDVRQTLIAECTRMWGVRVEPFNSWEEVIDESIYKHSGLRMIGANKGDKCSCKNKINDLCSDCGNRKKINTGRPYFPMACFGGDGLRNQNLEREYQADFCKVIEDCSIRAHGKPLTEGFKLYEGAPTHSTSFTKIKTKKRARSEDGPTMQVLEKHCLAPDAPEVTAIQSFFSQRSVTNQFCPDKYGDLVVAQVKIYKGNFKVDVTGANARFCMNKGDFHGGNRVFFEFRAATKDCSHGVVQRCYCEKLDVRKYGSCKDYESRLMLLPESITQILFPENAKPGSSRTSEHGSVLSRLDPRTLNPSTRSQSQVLLNAGNMLARELFGEQIQWTTSQRFLCMYGNSMLQAPVLRRDTMATPVYKPIRLDSLGPLNDKVMISLGFMEAHHAETEFKKIKASPTVQELQRSLSKTIKNILSVALHSEEDTVLEILQTRSSFKHLKELVSK